MTRWLPLVFVLLFVGVGFVWRAWLQQRRFGHSGIVVFRSGRWDQHLREAALLGLIGLLAVQAVWAAVDAPLLSTLRLPIGGGALATLLGSGLAFGGIALMVRAQLDMGASWRVGVDEGARPGLITGGVYRCSRNPIYLALFISLFGLLLLLPTWLSLAALAGTLIGIGRQVREEEAYLTRVYGDEYEDYASRVGRFVPGIGRLE